MGKLKMCTNESCVASQKKTKYKEKDGFCLKCGQELSFVCKKCRVLLQNHQEKLCTDCLVIAREKNEKNFRILCKIATGTAAAAVIATTAFPKLKKLSWVKKAVKKK